MSDPLDDYLAALEDAGNTIEAEISEAELEARAEEDAKFTRIVQEPEPKPVLVIESEPEAVLTAKLAANDAAPDTDGLWPMDCGCLQLLAALPATVVDGLSRMCPDSLEWFQDYSLEDFIEPHGPLTGGQADALAEVLKTFDVYLE